MTPGQSISFGENYGLLILHTSAHSGNSRCFATSQVGATELTNGGSVRGTFDFESNAFTSNDSVNQGVVYTLLCIESYK